MEKAIFYFWVFSFWIMLIISSDVSGHEETLLRVRMGENISLSCSMDSRYEISWYRQYSLQLTHLMSAKISTTAGRKLLVTFNRNRARLTVTADVEINTVSLVITGLTESDLAVYFCGTKSATSEMLFHKPVRLLLEDELKDKEDKSHSVIELPKDVDITDGVAVTERVLMFGGVALAIFVFFLTTVLAGGIIHQRGWQKGWDAAKRSSR